MGVPTQLAPSAATRPAASTPAGVVTPSADAASSAHVPATPAKGRRSVAPGVIGIVLLAGTGFSLAVAVANAVQMGRIPSWLWMPISIRRVVLGWNAEKVVLHGSITAGVSLAAMALGLLGRTRAVGKIAIAIAAVFLAGTGYAFIARSAAFGAPLPPGRLDDMNASGDDALPSRGSGSTAGPVTPARRKWAAFKLGLFLTQSALTKRDDARSRAKELVQKLSAELGVTVPAPPSGDASNPGRYVANAHRQVVTTLVAGGEPEIAAAFELSVKLTMLRAVYEPNERGSAELSSLIPDVAQERHHFRLDGQYPDAGPRQRVRRGGAGRDHRNGPLDRTRPQEQGRRMSGGR